MSTLIEFLKTDFAKGIIIKGTIDGWIAKEEGKGLEAELPYRQALQAEANRHRNVDYLIAATQQDIAFLRALTEPLTF